jgi:hypothetical protein
MTHWRGAWRVIARMVMLGYKWCNRCAECEARGADLVSESESESELASESESQSRRVAESQSRRVAEVELGSFLSDRLVFQNGEVAVVPLLHCACRGGRSDELTKHVANT